MNPNPNHMGWNKLLEKQVKTHLSEDLLARPEVQRLLNAVNNSYSSYERDRSLSAHAFSISEQEHAMINQQLQKEVGLKKLGIKNLKEAIISIEGTGAITKVLDEDEDNLLFALSYLKESVARQKAMERELKQSGTLLSAAAKTFSQLIRNLNNGIIVEDEHRKIVLANQLFCELMSITLPPDMLVGMDCSAAADICKNLFRDPDGEAIRVDEILSRKELVTGELLEMKNGKILLRDYIPIFVENEYKGHLWKFEDITRERERQQALQRLSLVASANENGVVFTNADGTITWANEGLSRMTGYSRKEITGQTPIGLCKGPQSDRKALKNMLDHFYAGKSFDIEVVHYRKDGSWFWGKVKGQSIMDDDGRIVQYFAMIEDITVRKGLELDLIEAKEQAEQSSRSKETFLANMSHEIRTPMNAILGMSRQLKKTTLTDQQKFFLDTVHSAADHLLVVINDILDISKIEAGRLVLENIGFSIREVAGRVQRVMLQKAEEKGLKLSFHLDQRIPDAVTGDPHRLSQVLLNLVSNSVKFTAKGEVRVAYELMPEGPVRITVTDTGIGMDQQFIPHLFRKFVQEDEAVARKFGGTGLGMSICQQLVDLMGGTIDVRSAKGKGTAVILQIPFDGAESTVLCTETPKATDTSILRSKRILLTEDNEMNRLLATTILHQYGALVDEAVDGQEAIDKMNTNRYDLVLMDMQMPVLDGLEATRHIRQYIDRAIPIIALTANAIKGENDKCMAAGMNDYLSKPFEEEDLIHMIARWLEISPAPHCSAPCNGTTTHRLYDLTKLRTIGRGEEKFVTRMVLLFLDQVPPAVEQIKQAAIQDELVTVKGLTHRIRPVIDNMGIVSLKEDLKVLETLAGAEGDRTRISQLIGKLDQVIRDVATDLHRSH